MTITISLKKFIIGVVVVLLFLSGIAFFIWKVLPQQTPKPNPATNIPTTIHIQIKDPAILKAAQDGITQFLNYEKATGTPDLKLTDYNNLKLNQAYLKDNEVHAIFLFSAVTTDSASLQKLITSGGTLEKNGWVDNAKAYIILRKSGNTYATKVIYLKQPDGF